MLKLSRAATYRLFQDLPRLKIGRMVRVAEEDLEAYLSKKTIVPWTAEASSRRVPRWAPLRAVAATNKSDWLRPIVPRTKYRKQRESSNAGPGEK